MSHHPEINSIVTQVREWPVEDRQALIAQLMTAAAPPTHSSTSTKDLGVRRESLGGLLGLANRTGRSFTDVELEELRLQALKEKHRL